MVRTHYPLLAGRYRDADQNATKPERRNGRAANLAIPIYIKEAVEEIAAGPVVAACRQQSMACLCGCRSPTLKTSFPTPNGATSRPANGARRAGCSADLRGRQHCKQEIEAAMSGRRWAQGKLIHRIIDEAIQGAQGHVGDAELQPIIEHFESGWKRRSRGAVAERSIPRPIAKVTWPPEKQADEAARVRVLLGAAAVRPPARPCCRVYPRGLHVPNKLNKSASVSSYRR